MTKYVTPQWSAPTHIQALTTTIHAPSITQLVEDLQLPSQPLSLKQIHSGYVINTEQHTHCREADGLYIDQPQTFAVIQTADCLPILLCDQEGSQIAALHAGWRGLANGIIQAGCQHFSNHRQNLLAWIGPSIGQSYYQVGPQVRDTFLNLDSKLNNAFQPSKSPGFWLADLKWIARHQLQKHGISTITTAPYCTYAQPELFYSYRRQKGTNGRLFTLIGIVS